MFPDIKLQPASLLVSALAVAVLFALAVTVNSSTLQPLNLTGCQYHENDSVTAVTPLRWQVDHNSRWPKSHDAWLDDEMIV
ncbi:hypothetical protein [Aliamphritea spongicola]|uniref:hypothetical protein n=1 Tax=Aliamphritea spongicola TaxID=707589 RepID=UPI00196A702B|nr:hypothetical protein [Aliamphritea spongicola]MBN3564676.1 hypothetical protein [Aliamphritea spongicola]